MQASKLVASAATVCGFLILGACSRGPLPESPFKAAELPADTFAIQSNRDTTLQTAGGARIAIPAGSLQATTGTTARLAIREAYTLGRMLRGGLTTLSGSDILGSGGMISIEPGAQTKPQLAKAITVSLPTDMIKPGMQLWRDTIARMRRFHWQQPIAITAGVPAQIPDFGWLGTGILIKDLEGFENSQLLAKFSGAEQDGISVYLLLPEDGIILEGGPSIGGAGSYAFYRNDGTVPLRIGKPAIVVGVKKKGDNWLYAMKSFTAKADQELQLELRPISTSELDQALDGLGR